QGRRDASDGASRDTKPQTLEQLGVRYGATLAAAVNAWVEDRATDDDARWLDAFLRRGLLNNSANMSARVAALAHEDRRVEAGVAAPRIVPGLTDCGPGFEQPVFLRGDCTKPGEPATRQYLEVLSGPARQFSGSGSGRLELAERIASSDNPLTARVMV